MGFEVEENCLLTLQINASHWVCGFSSVSHYSVFVIKPNLNCKVLCFYFHENKTYFFKSSQFFVFRLFKLISPWPNFNIYHKGKLQIPKAINCLQRNINFCFFTFSSQRRVLVLLRSVCGMQILRNLYALFKISITIEVINCAKKKEQRYSDHSGQLMFKSSLC